MRAYVLAGNIQTVLVLSASRYYSMVGSYLHILFKHENKNKENHANSYYFCFAWHHSNTPFVKHFAWLTREHFCSAVMIQ